MWCGSMDERGLRVDATDRRGTADCGKSDDGQEEKTLQDYKDQEEEEGGEKAPPRLQGPDYYYYYYCYYYYY